MKVEKPVWLIVFLRFILKIEKLILCFKKKTENS